MHVVILEHIIGDELCHVAVVCTINLLFQWLPLIGSKTELSYLVGIVHAMLRGVVTSNVHAHRDCTHECAHSATTKPDVNVLFKVGEVFPSIISMASEGIKELSFVLLQCFARYAIVATSL